MSDLILPVGLRELAPRYDLILCDVWGVIHNGRRAFTEACEALSRFREETGGGVILITNAPVPKARVLRYFGPLGVPDTAFDDCASSGDATRAELERRAHQSVWIYGADEGEEHDRFLYEGLPNPRVDGPEAELMLCIGMRDQFGDHPEDYRGELREIAAKGPLMVCANPDIQVRVGNDLVWCAGAMAAIYEEEGGKVIYPGKPHAPIYTLAREKAEALGYSTDPERTLAIGDGPVTDVRGANREGIDCLYVGSGLANEHGGDFAGSTRALLEKEGVRATYALPQLHW